MRGRVLIVDDEKELCKLLESELRDQGFHIAWSTSAFEAIDMLTIREIDVVLTDLRMAEMGGNELCKRISHSCPNLPVVVMTAFGSLDSAIASIRAGAYDFVTKPLEIPALSLVLDRAVRHRALQETVRTLTEEVRSNRGFGEIVGESPPIQKLCQTLNKLAPNDISVLILGESGTGKELVARALHGRSSRSTGFFVAINCAAVPETLLESELFGHVRGAFTDARGARKGLLEQASGGTVFLDEIGDMPASVQPKLLRALEEKRIRPLGSDAEIPIDVRILSATHCDIETLVEQGQFREDLYFRINVVQLHVPPLRARGSDILLLAQKFLEASSLRSGKAVTMLSAPVAEKLLAYSWPGNVRELRNCIERAVALTGHEHLVVGDLPEKVRAYRPNDLVIGRDPSELFPLEEIERRYILHVLESVNGHRTLAARILKLDRKTLYRKLERYTETQGS